MGKSVKYGKKLERNSKNGFNRKNWEKQVKMKNMEKIGY